MKTENKYYRKFFNMIDQTNSAQVKMLEILCFNCALHDELAEKIKETGVYIKSATNPNADKINPAMPYLSKTEDQILKYYKLLAGKSDKEVQPDELLDQILGG